VPAAHGCAEQAAHDLGLQYELEKVTDVARYSEFGVMFTPAMVVDGVVKVKRQGAVAGRDEATTELTAGCCQEPRNERTDPVFSSRTAAANAVRGVARTDRSGSRPAAAWVSGNGRSSAGDPPTRDEHRMLGYDDSEPLGDTFDELVKRIHADDAKEMRAKVGQHLRNETHSTEPSSRAGARDGSFAWLESRGNRGRTQPGRPAAADDRFIWTSVIAKANEQLRRDSRSPCDATQEALEVWSGCRHASWSRRPTQRNRATAAKNVLLRKWGRSVLRALCGGRGHGTPASDYSTEPRASCQCRCASTWS